MSPAHRVLLAVSCAVFALPAAATAKTVTIELSQSQTSVVKLKRNDKLVILALKKEPYTFDASTASGGPVLKKTGQAITQSGSTKITYKAVKRGRAVLHFDWISPSLPGGPPGAALDPGHRLG